MLLETAKEIIDQLGGDQPVADLFGVTTKAVSNWRVWNRFPPHTFPRLTDALGDRGCEAASTLWRFERARKAPNSAVASTQEGGAK